MEQIVWARSQIYWRNCIDRQSGFIESYQDQWSWLILPGEVFIVERLVSPAVVSCWLLDITLIKNLTTITYCNKEFCWKTSGLLRHSIDSFPTEVIGDAWFAVAEFEGGVLELRKATHLSFQVILYHGIDIELSIAIVRGGDLFV